MAAFDTTRPTVTTPTVSIVQSFGKLIAAFNTWNDARKTRHALLSLSARELDDIGLSYGDIDDVARRVSR